MFDAYLTTLNPDATNLEYSTYYGGAGDDFATDVVFWRGRTFIYGDTSSNNLPVALPYEGRIGGGTDTFLAKLGRDWTRSIYVDSADAYWQMFTYGSSLGVTGQGGVTILSFGKPGKNSAGGTTIYGTRVFINREFVPALASTSPGASIETNVQAFMRGWWYGYIHSHPLGNVNAENVTIVVGTTNCCNSEGNVSTEHAAAWAQLVSRLQDFAIGMGYWNMAVAAGMDAELDVNTAAQTLSWIDEYQRFFGVPHTPSAFVYNFGNCAGCDHCLRADTTPNDPTDNEVANCDLGNGWDMTSALQNAYAAFRLPLPEIYKANGANAVQWYALSRYSVEHGPDRYPIFLSWAGHASTAVSVAQ